MKEFLVKYFPSFQICNLAFTLGMTIWNAWNQKAFFTGLWVGVLMVNTGVYVLGRVRQASLLGAQEILEQMHGMANEVFKPPQQKKETPQA